MTLLFDRVELDQFRSLIARRFGLQFDDKKLDFLDEMVRRRMALTGTPRIETYLDQLNSAPQSAAEFRALAEALTVNETFFFRNADNFRALVESALPERIRARKKEKRLSILSAGCASGEEPYSLAIAVREALPDPAWEVKILALDLSPAMLAKAIEARYSAWSLRATSEEVKRRYFRAAGSDFVLAPAIRAMVTFEERNLVEDHPLFWQSLACDVVFCRNVLMYFTPESMLAVVRRLESALVPRGFLFLGHAETLRGLTEEFHLCHTHDTFYYRRREASETVEPSAVRQAPSRVAAEYDLPSPPPASISFVDVIQRASERIATLADGRSRTLDGDPPLALPISPPAANIATNVLDLERIREAIRQERFADGLKLLGALPPESHADPEALLLRAVLLTHSGRLDDSEAVCNRLLALDELNAGAHYLMALCREQAGDLHGAIEHNQTASYLDAGFAMPHLHLGILARRSGKAATAQRELGQALILLASEADSRLLLFGGGFSRATLLQLCRGELAAIAAIGDG